MNTCIQCAHWNLKGTDRAMAALGFAVCAKKKLVGHMVSSEAAACTRFEQLDPKAADARRAWLGKKSKV